MKETFRFLINLLKTRTTTTIKLLDRDARGDNMPPAVGPLRYQLLTPPSVLDPSPPMVPYTTICMYPTTVVHCTVHSVLHRCYTGATVQIWLRSSEMVHLYWLKSCKRGSPIGSYGSEPVLTNKVQPYQFERPSTRYIALVKFECSLKRVSVYCIHF